MMNWSTNGERRRKKKWWKAIDFLKIATLALMLNEIIRFRGGVE